MGFIITSTTPGYDIIFKTRLLGSSSKAGNARKASANFRISKRKISFFD